MGDIVHRAQVATEWDRRASVTNIGQLMDALTVGWDANSYDNRRLMAGEGGQFIRVDPRRYLHPFYKAWPGDIAIDSGGYRLAGFVQFEIPSIFRELFKTDRATDRVWYSAELTPRGYELAKAGILDNFTGLTNHPFFAPELREIDTAAALPMNQNPLGLKGAK